MLSVNSELGGEGVGRLGSEILRFKGPILKTRKRRIGPLHGGWGEIVGRE